MQSQATTVDEYIKAIPEERKEAFNKLRKTVLENMPKGFEERINYGMIGYVVPFKSYPDGYHCDTSLPLPFASIANQKNFIALHHMGIYADAEVLDWFVKEYPNYAKRKLDMGKSCIRFKKMDDIPYDLIAQLMQKMTVQNWIDLYEDRYKKK